MVGDIIYLQHFSDTCLGSVSPSSRRTIELVLGLVMAVWSAHYGGVGDKVATTAHKLRLGRLHTQALHVQIHGTQSRLESHRRMHRLQ